MISRSVALKGMQFFAHHGYYESERATGNRYEVDVVVHYYQEKENESPSDSFQTSNHISQVINYEQIASAVQDVMQEPTQLLETLCERIATKLQVRLSENKPSIEITVRKFNPPLNMLCAYSEVSLHLSA